MGAGLLTVKSGFILLIGFISFSTINTLKRASDILEWEQGCQSLRVDLFSLLVWEKRERERVSVWWKTKNLFIMNQENECQRQDLHMIVGVIELWWKTKNEIWEIYTPRIHWVDRGTGKMQPWRGYFRLLLSGWTRTSLGGSGKQGRFSVVYYKSKKREIEIRLMNESQWDGRLKTRVQETTCLAYTGLHDQTN